MPIGHFAFLLEHKVEFVGPLMGIKGELHVISETQFPGFIAKINALVFQEKPDKSYFIVIQFTAAQLTQCLFAVFHGLAKAENLFGHCGWSSRLSLSRLLQTLQLSRFGLQPQNGSSAVLQEA